MIKLTAAFVSQATGIRAANAAGDLTFSEVSTDSRKIPAACLFIALKGDKFDGHDFIAKAIEAGAAGILCESGRMPAAITNQVAVFECPDPLVAFRALAKKWRASHLLPVVAVAGSVGKTTTKDLLASLLRGKWSNVLQTQASNNGFLGIPLTLMQLRATHQAAVIEVGIDAPGAMEQHMNIVLPTAAILTAIGPEHLEHLIDIATVTKEESLALEMTADFKGQIVVNLSDQAIAPLAKELAAAKPWCFGLNLKPNQMGERVLSGMWNDNLGVLNVTGMGKLETFASPLPGEHNASNLLGAITVAHALGVTPDEMRAGLATCTISYGRSEVHELNGVAVICDYYNANPTSMLAAFKMLDQQHNKKSQKGTRWLVLGDMLELGKDEIKMHTDLASAIHSGKYEHVLLYGPRMQHLALQLRGQLDVHHAASHDALAKILKDSVKPHDSVLIKGSRGMRMEEIWTKFKA